MRLLSNIATTRIVLSEVLRLRSVVRGAVDGMRVAASGVRDLLRGHPKLSIRKLVKGSKWLLCMATHPRTHLRLFNVLASPEIRPAAQHDRKLVFKWFDTYLARGLSSHERARIMEGHYRFVRYRLDSRFMARVCEQPIVLWERTADSKDYRIVLTLPRAAYGED